MPGRVPAAGWIAAAALAVATTGTAVVLERSTATAPPDAQQRVVPLRAPDAAVPHRPAKPPVWAHVTDAHP